MKFRCTLHVVAMLALALIVSVAGHAQSSYSFRSLGTLGGTMSWGTDVNNYGQVVGSSFRPGGTSSNRDEHAFYWSNGVMVDMGSLGIYNSDAMAINDLGEVVGYSTWSSDPNLPTHAFYWNNQSRAMADLNGCLARADAAIWVLNSANDINNGRKVAGTGMTLVGGKWLQHAYVLDLNSAHITDLGTFGGSHSTASALNRLGTPQVVGSASFASDSSSAAFLYTGAPALLDLSPFLSAVGINDGGAIVGQLPSIHAGYRAPNGDVTDLRMLSDGTLFNMYARGINSAASTTVIGSCDTYVVVNAKSRIQRPRAWCWRVGETGITDLNNITPNRGAIFLRYASAVSDNGYIVGSGATEKNNGSTGNQSAYLLTPIP